MGNWYYFILTFNWVNSWS